MSRVTHSLVGYDRASERVAEEFEVPDTVLSTAKALARVATDDPDAMMCYRLDATGARNLAGLLGAVIDADRHDYFLEGHAFDAGSHDALGARGDLGAVSGE